MILSSPLTIIKKRIYETTKNVSPANVAANNGATTGTHEYDQSLSLFPLIGRRKCIILGLKSRAGFIAYPVVPPNDIPIDAISIPTGNGPAIWL